MSMSAAVTSSRRISVSSFRSDSSCSRYSEPEENLESFLDLEVDDVEVESPPSPGGSVRKVLKQINRKRHSFASLEACVPEGFEIVYAAIKADL